MVRWNNSDIEATSRHSPAGQRDFVKICGRTKHAFPLPCTRRVRERRGDALRRWIPFHARRTRLMKAEPRVHLNRSCSLSPMLAASLPAERWGVGCLRVGSKRCLPSNPPLSSSHQSCQLRRNLKIPAAIVFVLFSFQRQKMTRPAGPPSSPRLSAFHLRCKAAGAAGRGVSPPPAGNEALGGKFCGYFINEATDLFLWARPVSAAAGELRRGGGPLPPQPMAAGQPRWAQKRRAAAGAHARAGGGSPRCTVQPSQRLLVSRRSEPADRRGSCPLLRFWNESAAPAHAEADAQDKRGLHCVLPRVKLFRGAKVPVCHSDGRVINGFGRTGVRWL